MRLRSLCPLCSLGCGLWLLGEREVEGLDYDLEHPTSSGALCERGNLLPKLPYHQERLLKPLVKRGEDYGELSWEEALHLASSKLNEALKEYGGKAVVLLSSGFSTNEENLLLRRLAERLGVKACYSPSITSGLREVLGFESTPGRFEELARADHLLIYGNPLEQNPVSARAILKAKFEGGAWLTIIDARRGKTAWFSNLLLQPKPGSEGLLLAGILKRLAEAGLPENLRGVEGFLAELPLNRIEEATGIPISALAEEAEGLRKASKPYIVYTSTILHAGRGALQILALIACLTCLPKGGGIIALEGPINAQGAKDLLEEPSLEEARFLLTLGSLPERLKPPSVEFTVSTEQFKPVDAEPELLIPTAWFMEKRGTITGFDGFVQRLEPFPSPSRVKTDLDFLFDLSNLLGVEIGYRSLEDLWGELVREFPAYKGLRLKPGWREPPEAKPQSPSEIRLEFEVFKPDEAYPLVAVTEPRAFSPAGWIAFKLVEEILGRPYPFLEVNPSDIQALNLKPGGLVRLVSEDGDRSPPLRVLASDSIPPGVCFTPDWKTCRVRVERLEGGRPG